VEFRHPLPPTTPPLAFASLSCRCPAYSLANSPQSLLMGSPPETLHLICYRKSPSKRHLLTGGPPGLFKSSGFLLVLRRHHFHLAFTPVFRFLEFSMINARPDHCWTSPVVSNYVVPLYFSLPFQGEIRLSPAPLILSRFIPTSLALNHGRNGPPTLFPQCHRSQSPPHPSV